MITHVDDVVALEPAPVRLFLWDFRYALWSGEMLPILGFPALLSMAIAAGGRDWVTFCLAAVVIVLCGMLPVVAVFPVLRELCQEGYGPVDVVRVLELDVEQRRKTLYAGRRGLKRWPQVIACAAVLAGLSRIAVSGAMEVTAGDNLGPWSTVRTWGILLLAAGVFGWVWYVRRRDDIAGSLWLKFFQSKGGEWMTKAAEFAARPGKAVVRERSPWRLEGPWELPVIAGLEVYMGLWLLHPPERIDRILGPHMHWAGRPMLFVASLAGVMYLESQPLVEELFKRFVNCRAWYWLEMLFRARVRVRQESHETPEIAMLGAPAFEETHAVEAHAEARDLCRKAVRMVSSDLARIDGALRDLPPAVSEADELRRRILEVCRSLLEHYRDQFRSRLQREDFGDLANDLEAIRAVGRGMDQTIDRQGGGGV